MRTKVRAATAIRLGLSASKQIGQFGEIHRQPPGFVLGQHIGSRASAGLFLEVKIAKLLSVLVADDEAGVVYVLDGPGRRKAGN